MAAGDKVTNVHSKLHDLGRELAQYMDARITAGGVEFTEHMLQCLRTELMRTADSILSPPRTGGGVIG